MQEHLEHLDLEEKRVVELQVQQLRNELARKEAKLAQQKQDLLTHANISTTEPDLNKHGTHGPSADFDLKGLRKAVKNEADNEDFLDTLLQPRTRVSSGTKAVTCSRDAAQSGSSWQQELFMDHKAQSLHNHFKSKEDKEADMFLSPTSSLPRGEKCLRIMDFFNTLDPKDSE